MNSSKPKELRDLFAKQNPFDLRRLAAAFVEMVGALKSRPQPRSWFDNVASPDRADPKGLDAVLAGRIAINAAIQTQCREMIEETAGRVSRYFRTCEDVALAPYHAITNGSISIADARTRASKETHEALHAIWANGDGASDLTIRELDEAIAGLCDLRAALVGRAAQPLNRRAQVMSV